ncbi:MAG TPA: hypothetical protein VJO54_12880 [Burkholderiales bacterium]|nr:hypothetical protein [Burkholderiales bacterium]
MRQSAYPRQSVLPHLEYARRSPLRATRLFTAVGLVSVLGYGLGLAAAIGLGAMIAATLARNGETAAPASRASFDPSPYLLNAFLVPALDGDAVPLRWVDPRPAIGCGRGTTVRVNGEKLRPGDAVPEAPFDLEWWADGCHPFGAQGPRLDGGVKLKVFREDWGFSAMVAPFGLYATSGGAFHKIERSTATYPRCSDGDGPCR